MKEVKITRHNLSKIERITHIINYFTLKLNMRLMHQRTAIQREIGAIWLWRFWFGRIQNVGSKGTLI